MSLKALLGVCVLALPWTAGSAFAGSPRTDIQQALTLYWTDRYGPASAIIDRLLDQDKSDRDALLLRSQILGARLAFDRARQALDQALSAHAQDPLVRQRRAELARDAAVFARSPLASCGAEEEYQAALALEPERPATLLSMAAYLYVSGQPARAGPLYGRVSRLRPFVEREMVLDDAMILLMRGDTRAARQVTSDYRARFGEDSVGLLAEATVLFGSARASEGATLLARARQRNPDNLAVAAASQALIDAAGMTGMPSPVAAMPGWSPRESAGRYAPPSDLPPPPPSPSDPRTPGASPPDGPIVYSIPTGAGTVTPSLLTAVKNEFAEAFQEVADLLGHRPDRVKVQVVLDTGSSHPAFYDPSADTVTIAAIWFDHSRLPGHIRLSPPQLRRLTRHVVRHELAHMVLAHSLGIELYRRGASSLPLWLHEGLAEWTAGGADNACRTALEIQGLFASGFMDQDAMTRAMRYDGTNPDPALNHKAYVQAFFLVKYLMMRAGSVSAAVRAIQDFARDLMTSSATLEGALLARFGLTETAFQEGWRALLQRDLLDTSDPVLSSLPAHWSAGGGNTHSGGTKRQPVGDDGSL
ncbi:MAG: hypothetical protein HY815_21900 [Candidatus Riflebacteria bacterium]|nr:hypothetical protein [Candidatus Riflebacteria bacterium]